MISLAKTNAKSSATQGVTRKSAKSKPVALSRNQLIAFAVAFGLAAFTVVLLSAVWTYVMVHGALAG